MNFFRFLENKETYFRAIQEAARREYSYQHLSEAIEPTIVRKKYGIGGKVMLRGPMCPNFLEEHVIGNIRRGRLCTNAKDPDYVYYFDRQDRLVKVDKNTEVGVCTEYILSEGDMRLGFLFTGEKARAEAKALYAEDPVAKQFFDENGITPFLAGPPPK